MTKEEIISLMNSLANQTLEAMETIDKIDALFEKLAKVSPELFRWDERDDQVKTPVRKMISVPQPVFLSMSHQKPLKDKKS